MADMTSRILMALALSSFSCLADAGVVARVGGESITEHDVAVRSEVLRASGDESPFDAVLARMMGEAIEKEVARTAHAQVSGVDLARFGAHVDATTQSPVVLRALREILALEPDGFNRHVLAPRLQSIKLREHYSRDPSKHVRERWRIDRAYSLLASGASSVEAASAVGAQWRRWVVMPVGREPGPSRVPLAQAPDPLLPVVASLADGQLHDRVIEDENGFRVVRRIAPKGMGIEVESVTVAKRPFEEWYRELAATVSIRIADGCKRSLCASYAHTWWLSAACGGRSAPSPDQRAFLGDPIERN